MLGNVMSNYWVIAPHWRIGSVQQWISGDLPQCAFYWDRHKQDKWGFKSLVSTAWILDFANELLMSFWTYLAIYVAFLYTPTNLLNDDRESRLCVSLCSAVRLESSTISAYLTKIQFPSFYIRRAYLPLGVGIPTIPGFRHSKYAVLPNLSPFQWLRQFWLISEAATDILVSSTVVYALTAGKVAASRNTKRGLKKLILYTISDGILTTVVAVAVLILV
ncbi:hypothetical protein DL93DRAFT_2206082 [Clavulina sp. PMI_390]|nr:hypothetical protein DL93DRAFT_2206082 [Clavulina sp. PMI_390]